MDTKGCEDISDDVFDGRIVVELTGEVLGPPYGQTRNHLPSREKRSSLVRGRRAREEEFQKAEEALALVQQAIGPAREAMVKLATDILALEREIDRNERVHTRLVDLQDRLKAWAAVTSKERVTAEAAASATSKKLLAS